MSRTAGACRPWGWRIRDDTPDALVVDAEGRLMAGRLVFTVGTDVVWATMPHFRSPTGRTVWSAAGHLHRAAAPRCLAGARRALLRPHGPA